MNVRNFRWTVNINWKSSWHCHLWLVPCFLRAAYTTALQPFAIGGPRTKVLSPTGSSSPFISLSLHSVFEMFHCSRETASCKHDTAITATLQFNNNLQYIQVYFQNVFSATLHISLTLMLIYWIHKSIGVKLVALQGYCIYHKSFTTN